MSDGRATQWLARGSGSALLLVVLVASSGAAGLVAQQPEAKEQYGKLCAPCHGAAGRGDGPAAVAFTPRPASFAEPAFQASRTDEQLTAAIADGKLPMPTFGKQLSTSQIRALVAYIRELGKKK
jgi:mono/diheme cytochrome c family protein